MGDSDPAARLHQTIDASPLARTQNESEWKNPEIIPFAAGPPASAAAPPEAAAATSPLAAAAAPNVASPSGPPTRIGRYVILRALGEGGMGVVYAGYDEELDRKVAIKLLHPSQQGDSQLRARIVREAQALARVSAPNVVHVYEVGEFAGQVYIVMEFVNGTTLTKWQSEKGRSLREILRMYCAAGQGLLEAHQAGLVHRDFKPDNVLLGQDGRPRVADFGLARLQNRGGIGGAVSAAYTGMRRQESSNPRLAPITQLGMVLGTPLYMSPEQHLGEAADSRSDQFSFCVALYEALYQQLPFAGDTVSALAVNTVKGAILPRPAKSRVPGPVHDALLRGLSTAPAQRFPSLQELLAALAFDSARDPATAPRRRRLVTFFVPASLTLSALGLWLLRWLGVDEMRSALVVSALLFTSNLVWPLRFRRVLLNNSFHRGVMVVGVAFSGQLFSMLIVATLTGLTMTQVAAQALVAVLSLSCVMSALFLPKLWPQVPISAVATFWGARHPEYAQPLAAVMVPASILSAIFLWNRAAKSQGTKRRLKTEHATTPDPNAK